MVLDASESLSAAGRTAAAIEGRHPRTRVSLVSDGTTASAPAFRALPKWGALESLADAVLHVYAAKVRGG